MANLPAAGERRDVFGCPDTGEPMSLAAGYQVKTARRPDTGYVPRPYVLIECPSCGKKHDVFVDGLAVPGQE